MPRTINITVPSSQSESLVHDVRTNLESIISLQLFREASIKPKGDVIAIEVANKHLPELMRLLNDRDIGSTDDTSITSSEPLSIISKSSNYDVSTDTNESGWEEADQIIVSESNATHNMLIIMFLAGAIATIGIASNSLHVVIGAMVIAPAFEPVMRIPLSIVSRNRMLTRALIVNLRVYSALVLGALVTALIMAAVSNAKFGATSSYLGSFSLLDYWSTITVSSVIVSALAGIAGALLIITNRSVLGLGSMIALALIPSAVLFGIGLAHLDTTLMITGATRWLIDVSLVVLGGLAVFYWKKRFVHKRQSMPVQHS